MNQAILTIKDTIKQHVAESLEICKQIRASKGLERYQLWNQKRAHGDGTRYWLLAYGCLRGRPYASIEAKCGEGNTPSASAILNRILSVLPQEGPEKAEWTKERVKAWLTRPESSEAAPVAAEGKAA